MAYLDNNGVLYFWQKIKTYVANAISGKVDAETGKGLSTNDYTTEEKTKLSNISAGAQVNVLEGIQKNGDTVTITNKIANISVPTKTSDLTNDSNFITLADVPDGAVASTTTPSMDGTASAGTETAFARGDHVHPHDSTKVDKVSGKGLSTNDYTTAEKEKLAGIEAGAQVNPTNVSAFTNDAGYLTQHQDISGKVDKVSGKGLSTNDYTTAEKNKLAGIESGAEENVIETISVNGSEQTVTDKTVDITVPTKVSDLTNDSGFLTSYTETDPTVPAWAKAANKPTYTAAEVGAYTKPSGGIPASDLASGVIPTVPQMATEADMSDWTRGKTVDALTLKAYFGGALQSLDAISSDIGQIQSDLLEKADKTELPDASTSAPVMDGTAAVGTSDAYARADHVHPSDSTKVDKVDGKGLSTNDYTTAEKNKLAAFGAASTYALKTDITNMYKYKGSVAAVANLPSSGNTTGDVYNVEASGMNYAWNGSEWDALGEIFTITAITNSEIDTICT